MEIFRQVEVEPERLAAVDPHVVAELARPGGMAGEAAGAEVDERGLRRAHHHHVRSGVAAVGHQRARPVARQGFEERPEELAREEGEVGRNDRHALGALPLGHGDSGSDGGVQGVFGRRAIRIRERARGVGLRQDLRVCHPCDFADFRGIRYDDGLPASKDLGADLYGSARQRDVEGVTRLCAEEIGKPRLSLPRVFDRDDGRERERSVRPHQACGASCTRWWTVGVRTMGKSSVALKLASRRSPATGP